MTGWKELIVVLTFATIVWVGARRFATAYVPAQTYDRRMYAWMGLTAVAFLSPSFWIYALVAMLVFLYLGRRDDNPHAVLMIFFYLIPPLSIEIPAIGINRIFGVSQARLLSMFLLVPVMVRILRSGDREQSRLRLQDASIIAFCLLQVVLFMPYEDITNTVRRSFLFLIDSIVVVYVMSRMSADRRKLIDVLVSFSLVCCIFALVGIFETTRDWLMYPVINTRWGDPNRDAWLFRGDALRAQASAGHSLTLGILLTVALAFSLYAARTDTRRRYALLVPGLLCAGLYATHSRGPWMAGMLVVVLGLFLSATTASAAVRRMGVIAIVALGVLMSPIGDSVIQKLPFVGQKDFNVEYRERLIDVSLQLISVNPAFGDPFVLRNMEDLRQGQGIIDLVNAYLAVALFNGLVGLALYVSLYVVTFWKVGVAWWRSRGVDDELTLICALMLAMLTALMFLLGTSGMILTQYALAGLAISASRLAPRSARERSGTSAGSRTSTRPARPAPFRVPPGPRAMPQPGTRSS